MRKMGLFVGSSRAPPDTVGPWTKPLMSIHSGEQCEMLLEIGTLEVVEPVQISGRGFDVPVTDEPSCASSPVSCWRLAISVGAMSSAAFRLGTAPSNATLRSV